MTPPYTLDQLNRLDREQFVAALGGIFEHSPWVAEQAYPARPFASLKHLHQTMTGVVGKAPPAVRRALICSHPELAGREATAGTLTHDSRSEQASAGLDQCTTEEFARLKQLNAAYRQRFGFPFIIAVRGLNRQEILTQMEARLANTPEAEFSCCIDQIARIAELRLQALIAAE